MAVVLRSLADFKRFLAQPGATIQIIQNTFIDRQPESARAAYRDKGMYELRTVHALSRKAAVFSLRGHPTTVWLYWDKGTRRWKFSGDTVRIPLDTSLGPPDEIVYRCFYAPGYEPKERRAAAPAPAPVTAGCPRSRDADETAPPP